MDFESSSFLAPGSEGLTRLLGFDPGGGGSLVDVLLTEQGDLTAVERFAQFHEHVSEPLQGRYYSSLIPASPPGPGQQLAFEVDLDRCSGCKACVAACHALNGLDEGECWREVGLVVGGRPGLPVLQHVTSACHHCLDPACLNACPVDAYEKDPVTGIVKHLDDQCFGCQYCTLACPYDVPKFHPGKGIVRKCDMCGDRLRAGEAPACVQACPHEAIRIRVVDRNEIVTAAAAVDFLPTAPSPDVTLPTTRYLRSRPLPGNVLAADHHRIEPEHAHAPLVVMLVLTQLAVGGFLMDLVGRLAGWSDRLAASLLLGFSLVILFLGLGASTCHLGRPLYAYRALIGLRHSWLSREVVAFGLFAKLALAQVALNLLRPGWFEARPALRLGLSAAVVSAGLAGLICSVMVYHVVRRPFWQARLGGTRFAGSALLLGLATAWLASAWAGVLGGSGERCPIEGGIAAGVIVAAVAKLLFEATILKHLRDASLSPLRKTALLLCGPLVRVTRLRVALGIGGGVLLPGLLIVGGMRIAPLTLAVGVSVAWLAVLGGELAERYLFFAAVVRPKMPGGVLP